MAEEINFFHIQWHLTEGCNLRCKHCYQKEYDPEKDISTEQAMSFLDHYFEVIKKWGKTASFSLTGGEPLTRKDLFDIIAKIKGNEIPSWVYILTNGTLIDKAMARRIKESGVDSVQISLDGARAETHDAIRGKGNFDRAVKGIRNLLDEGVRVSTHYVMHKQNVSEVSDVIDLGTSLGVKNFTITRLVPIGVGKAMKELMLEPLEVKEVFTSLYRKQEELNSKGIKCSLSETRPLWCLVDGNLEGVCPVGINGLAILSDGTILPCRRFPIKIGNILEDSLYDVWYNSDVLWELRNRNNVEECGSCENKTRCWGCRGMAWAYYGNYMKPDPQCWKLFKKLPEGMNPPKMNKEGYFELKK